MTTTANGAQPTVYGHFISQPTRSVIWALNMKNVPFTFVKRQPIVGDGNKPEFLAKFPTGTFPALEDGDLRITEGNAILTYLAQKHQWTDWYPGCESTPASESEWLNRYQKRAVIDMWLHWLHLNLRPASMIVFRVFITNLKIANDDAALTEVAPKMGKQLAQGVEALRDPFEVLSCVLASQHRNGIPFICSASPTSGPTLVDIAFYSELDQLETMGFADAVQLFKEYPSIVRWMGEMKKLPKHDDVRRTLRKVSAMFHPIVMKAVAAMPPLPRSRSKL